MIATVGKEHIALPYRVPIWGYRMSRQKNAGLGQVQCCWFTWF